MFFFCVPLSSFQESVPGCMLSTITLCLYLVSNKFFITIFSPLSTVITCCLCVLCYECHLLSVTASSSAKNHVCKGVFGLPPKRKQNSLRVVTKQLTSITRNPTVLSFLPWEIKPCLGLTVEDGVTAWEVCFLFCLFRSAVCPLVY